MLPSGSRKDGGLSIILHQGKMRKIFYQNRLFSPSVRLHLQENLNSEKKTDFFYYASRSPCCHSATRLYFEHYLFSRGLLCPFSTAFSHRPLIQYKYSLPSVFLLWWNSETSQLGQTFQLFIRGESKKSSPADLQTVRATFKPQPGNYYSHSHWKCHKSCQLNQTLTNKSSNIRNGT